MKSGRRWKWLLPALLLLFIFYLPWLSVQILRFKPHQAEPPSRPRRPHEIVGVYHLHTAFSDGHASPDTIARLASRRSLDFIILTDHGNPNLACLASQGWKDGLLVLAGSELSVSRGHLVALDFAAPAEPFSQNAEDAVKEVKAGGGFTVIAHPFSKTRWSWGEQTGYAGLEIIDTDSMLKRNFFPSLPYLPALVLKPGFYLLKLLERPTQTLRKWDELNLEQRLSGYFSADAHLFYGALLSGFHLHALLRRPLAEDFEKARAQVFRSLRRGQFYNAIEAAGSARGFRFWAERRLARVPMGSVVPFRPKSPLRLRARAPFPRATEIRLIHNGKTVLKSNQKRITFLAEESGVYRVEVYLTDRSALAPDIPWIVSNPIFLRKDGQ